MLLMFAGRLPETPLPEFTSKMILPAISPAPLFDDDVLMLALKAFIAVAADVRAPLEMKTEPPSAEVLAGFAEACADMLEIAIAPDETRDTGPAVPFNPEASVTILPATCRSVAPVFAAEFTNITSPPADGPDVVIEPVTNVAAFPELPVPTKTYPPEPVLVDCDEVSIFLRLRPFVA